MKLKIQNYFVIQLRTRFWHFVDEICFYRLKCDTLNVVVFGVFLVSWFYALTFSRALLNYFGVRFLFFWVNQCNMKWGIIISEIVPFYSHHTCMKLTFHKIHGKKSTLQKVHNIWEKMDEICTLSKLWMPRLRCKNKEHWRALERILETLVGVQSLSLDNIISI